MTQINDPKLLPCPFCGEDAAIWYYPASERLNRKDSYYVGCTNDHCGCEMEHDGGWKTYDDAMNAWNRRGNYSEIPTGSTTKNDLGVDCISRIETIDYLCKHCPDDGECFKDCDEIKHLRQMPSVTPQEPRWISVSERLPDTDDEVLCWYEYYHWSQEKVLPEYGLGCYFKETKSWFGEVANGKDVRVIAWMPLPKPYEPQESEDKE